MLNVILIEMVNCHSYEALCSRLYNNRFHFERFFGEQNGYRIQNMFSIKKDDFRTAYKIQT